MASRYTSSLSGGNDCLTELNERISKIPEDCLTVDQYSGVIPNGEYQLKIYCKDMELGKQFKDLILDNQAIVEKVKRCFSDYDDIVSLNECAEMIQEIQKILQTTKHSDCLERHES